MKTSLPDHLDSESRNVGYLAKHGEKLLDNGYQIVPIRVGHKSPGFDHWQKAKATKGQLKEWLEHGHRNSGVGILTKNTPAIDIDVRDESIADKLDAWIREHLGGTLVRVGRAPKRLFLFRTDTPFRKIQTTKRIDEWGDEQQIEVLGDGQQFVAYHKHPDTGKPYLWTDEDSQPLNVPVSALPTLDMEKLGELLDYFEELADAEGWKVKRGARRSSGGGGDFDFNDPFLEDTQPVNLIDEEIRSRLMLIPDPDADYDTWLQVGMALYHQWNGDQPGLQYWHEWSETGDKYDADALERKWEDFGINGKKRAPVTARLILKLSQESVANTTVELSLKLRDAFQEAKTIQEWEKAKQLTRNAEIDGLARASLAMVAKERRDTITGTKTSLVEVKKAIAYAPTRPEKTPKWARDWIYDTGDDRFFNTDRKIAATQQGFNAMYDREALTKKDVLDGKTSGTSTASALALNLYRITTVTGRRYEPGRDAIFHEPDGTFANTYPEHEIPEIPEKLIPRDKKNVERVKRHITHLLPNEHEARMFLDWLAWIVQNPGQHANYAILLQGVEGDGKSFFAEMLRAVMGVSNVTMLNAHIFESDFTDWCVGQCVVCVEEVRLIKATNKYEVINRIKPIITNRIIEVHPKGKPVYDAKNTSSYLLFTNFKDALPLDDDGRRFLVLFSQWQRKSALEKFNEENPTYYEDLYNSIDESPGAIRNWLLNHEFAEGFKPKGNAPQTAARKFMVRESKPEFIRELEELIEENTELMVSEELVNVTALSEILMSRGLNVPANRSIQSMMRRYGYEDLGKVFLDGARSTFYSKEPELFMTKNEEGVPETCRKAVKNYIKKRENDLSDDEL